MIQVLLGDFQAFFKVFVQGDLVDLNLQYGFYLLDFFPQDAFQTFYELKNIKTRVVPNDIVERSSPWLSFFQF